MAAIGRDIDVVVIEFSVASKGACDSRRDVHSRGLWLIDGNFVDKTSYLQDHRSVILSCISLVGPINVALQGHDPINHTHREPFIWYLVIQLKRAPNVVGNVFIATQIQVSGINDDLVIDRGDAADAVGSILRLQFRAECVGYAIEPDPTMIGRDGQIGKGDSRIPGQLIKNILSDPFISLLRHDVSSFIYSPWHYARAHRVYLESVKKSVG